MSTHYTGVLGQELLGNFPLGYEGVAGHFTFSLSDSITTTESLARHITANRPIADTKASAESLTKSVSNIRTVGDTLTLTETLTALHGHTFFVNDTLTTVDSLSRWVALHRNPVDASGLVESLARHTSAARALSDTRAAPDVASVSNRFVVRYLGDTLTTSDLASRANHLHRTLAEAFTLFDLTVVDLEPVLYTIVDKSNWLSQPFYVRYRAVYRGPRESYKINRDIAMLVLNIRKLYEQYMSISDSFDSQMSTIDLGGQPGNGIQNQSGDPLVLAGKDSLAIQINQLALRVRNLELARL